MKQEKNLYGFDFLQEVHNEGEFSNTRDEEVEESPIRNKTKTDLEKQFDVIQFLQTHRSSGCLSPEIIYKSTGVDLSEGGFDEKVAQMLDRNSKIRIEEIPDPENPLVTLKTFGYLAKFNISHKAGLLAQINRCKNGVSMRDLSDAYIGVEEDLTALLTGGDVVGVDNPEDKDKTLFPRGEPFLVELEGNLFEAVRKKEHQNQHNMNHHQPCDIVKIDVDPRKQIRRGEAILIAGQWFRIDSKVRDLPLSEQPVRAQARPSVVLLKDLSKKNDLEGYIKPFNSVEIPLDSPMTPETQKNLQDALTARRRLASEFANLKTVLKNSGAPNFLSSDIQTLLETSNKSSILRKRPTVKGNQSHSKAITDAITSAQHAASNPALLYSRPRRHGFSKDVREMYMATRSDVPTDPVELHALLIKTKLIEENESMARPPLIKKRINVDNDGKPIKRRYYERKNQRFTNWHLHGTEIGAVLTRAAERQQQGKSVGDGGM